MPKFRAVFIDDDYNLGTTLKLVLGLAGFEVEHIGDSKLAMERLIEVVPELVVLDLYMPIVSGLDILKAMREDVRLVNVKVIIMTSNSSALSDETLKALADLILVKPVSALQISDLALQLIGHATD